jgi:hypothetical protein
MYAMYWEYFDADTPARIAIQEQTDAAVIAFEQQADNLIACSTVSAYAVQHFRGA